MRKECLQLGVEGQALGDMYHAVARYPLAAAAPDLVAE